MNPTIDRIIVGIMFLNTMINAYLLTMDSWKNREKSLPGQNDRGFFKAYMMFVPFFITRSILKEIEEKRSRIKGEDPKSK